MIGISALIALGGNLGNTRETFVQARRELAETEGLELIASSRLYRTPPVGPAGQPDYLNAVVSIQTTLQPLQLLEQLHDIENRHGRVRKERWGARTLDLDIVAMGGEIIETETLSIPHPMMHKRLFVLCPLCDIDPNWQHPLLKVTAEQLMQQLIREGEVALPEGEAW